MPSITKVLTRIAYDWAIRCFGLDHVTNFPVRALRNLEESAELAQALGVPRETAHLCIDQVYDRPVGNAEQEVGGVMVTLNILCESMGMDSEALYEQEVRRILKKSPEHFAKRNQEKIDILDASAQTPGDPKTCTRDHLCGSPVGGPCNGYKRPPGVLAGTQIPRRPDGTPIGDGGPMER